VLEIFLDSLDECLIHLPTSQPLLVDEFKKYCQPHATSIGLPSCGMARTAEQELPRYGAPRILVRMSSPRSGVWTLSIWRKSLAYKRCLSQEVEDRTWFRSHRAVTLQLLLRVFPGSGQRGQLPGTRVDLYERVR